MAYEEFTAKSRATTDIPMISILKQGVIGINSECYKMYFKNYKYIIFFFDKENKKIGIKPTNEPSGNTYSIRMSRDGKLASVSATAFLNYYKIPHKESKSYPCDLNEAEKILEVKLKWYYKKRHGNIKSRE